MDGRTALPATLFVYGTLKRGERNHRLLRGQRFVGDAVTAPAYRVVDLGPHPGLIRDATDGLAVHGELWEVTAEALADLDEFEGVPTLFTREPIAMPGFAGAVQAYFWARAVPPGVTSGERWPVV